MEVYYIWMNLKLTNLDWPGFLDRIDTTSNDVGARTAGKAFGTEGYGSHQDPTNQGLHRKPQALFSKLQPLVRW